MKKFFLILALICTGGLAVFFFSNPEKNGKKIKKVIKSAKKYAEETMDSVEDNGFSEMGWSDLDWTNEEMLAKKAHQIEKSKPVQDLKAYLAKAEKPVKKVVKQASKEIEKTEKVVKKKVAALESKLGLNERQDKILSILKNKRKLNMMELATEFVDVTSRTLRRDMEKLEKQKIVRQVGKTRDSFYELLKF